MKKYLPILLVAGLLGGCNLLSSPNSTRQNTQASPSYTLAASHWGDVAKIRNEATRLGYEVTKGRMTKTQAAQQLNRFRINRAWDINLDIQNLHSQRPAGLAAALAQYAKPPGQPGVHQLPDGSNEYAAAEISRQLEPK